MFFIKSIYFVLSSLKTHSQCDFLIPLNHRANIKSLMNEFLLLQFLLGCVIHGLSCLGIFKKIYGVFFHNLMQRANTCRSKMRCSPLPTQALPSTNSGAPLCRSDILLSSKDIVLFRQQTPAGWCNPDPVPIWENINIPSVPTAIYWSLWENAIKFLKVSQSLLAWLLFAWT